MERSETTGALYAALAKAQAAYPAVPKTKTATIPGKEGKSGYSYKYADLPDLLDAVRGPLSANGLAVSQDIGSDGETVIVQTVLGHSSGEWIATGWFGLPQGGTPQTAGSASTYGRRYSLASLLGIAADEDDDGAGATHSADARASSGKASASKGATAKQSGMLHGLKRDLTISDAMWATRLNDKYGVEHVDQLTSAQASELITALKAKLDARPTDEQVDAAAELGATEVPYVDPEPDPETGEIPF